MSVNVESNVMRADPPKGHLVNGKNSVSSGSMESVASTHGVTIKTSVLKLRSELKGVDTPPSDKLYVEMMGEPREDKKKSMPGFYIFFKASDVDGLSKEEISRRFLEIVLKALYLGSSGNLFVRMMAPKYSPTNDHGLSRYMFEHDLLNKDVKVLFFTFVNEDGTLSDKSVCTKIEHELHAYCKEHRADGLKFSAAPHSAENGKNGQKATKVKNNISKMSTLQCNNLIIQAVIRKVEIDLVGVTTDISDHLAKLFVDVEEDEEV